MDICISGSGTFAGGEYENVSISGEGFFSGAVRCKRFHISGEGEGEALHCEGELSISGSGNFHRGVRVGSLAVSGEFECAEALSVAERIKCSGSVQCGATIKCAQMGISGSIEAEGDIEAERVEIHGTLCCKGLLNAEKIVIKSENGMQIGSISGSKITVCKPERKRRLPLFSSLLRVVTRAVQIDNAIEGDVIVLENVHVPRVSGRVVTIGEDCEIALVQYSERVEISPKAKVGRTEKLS